MNIKGVDILFTLDGNFIACADAADININVQMIPARQPNSGKGKRFIPDKITGNISISGTLTFDQRSDIYTSLDQFQKVTFSYHTADANDGKFSGNCWVQTWGETSPSSSFARYNAVFIIDGLPLFTPEVPDNWDDELEIVLQDELGVDLQLG